MDGKSPQPSHECPSQAIFNTDWISERKYKERGRGEETLENNRLKTGLLGLLRMQD